jgi:hypothetical protein
VKTTIDVDELLKWAQLRMRQEAWYLYPLPRVPAGCQPALPNPQNKAKSCNFRGTENPRVGGSIPSLGTQKSRQNRQNGPSRDWTESGHLHLSGASRVPAGS